jgi:hypothetical protein
MKRGRGQPPLNPSITMTIWVMVELMRDRQQVTRERWSAREGCNRLEKHLAKCSLDGRHLPLETIRDHYKKFERVMRRSNSGAVSELARLRLAFARLKRDLSGWDISTWALVVDPFQLEAAGYKLTLEPTGCFKLTLEPIKPNTSPTN